jgi:DNA-binding MarR family transcriptional regulator
VLELLPTALDRELAGTGVTSFEFSVLEALDEAEMGRLRLSALASRTNATLPRLSRVVTGLEAKGLIERVACEEDGRATNAVLTTAGQNVYRESRPKYNQAVRNMILDGLGDPGTKQLAELTHAILGRLDPERRLSATASVDSPFDPAPTRPPAA